MLVRSEQWASLAGEAARYVLVGCATFLVFVGVNWALLNSTSMPEGLVTAIAVVAAGILNFIGQARFAFRTRRSALAILPSYVVLSLCNAMLAGVVVEALRAWLRVSLVTANAAALVFVTVSAFFFMKYVVMRPAKTTP